MMLSAFMGVDESESNVDSLSLAVKIHSVNRHQNDTADPDVAQSTDHRGAFRREHQRPKRQECKQQNAHGDEDEMKAFEGHGWLGC